MFDICSSFINLIVLFFMISSGLLLAGILAIMIFLPLYDTREEIFISIEFLFFYFLLLKPDMW